MNDQQVRWDPLHPRSTVNVVLFSGGRGSSVLSRELIGNPAIRLTLAVNGYDDGASTGEVRRFLGEALGPSDFRKNASRLARELGSCPIPLIDLLDARLPPAVTSETAEAVFDAIRRGSVGSRDPTVAEIGRMSAPLEEPSRSLVSARLDAFEHERARTDRPFEFSACSLGNLVFAGGFLLRARQFNAAVDDYCALLGLPSGLVDNVTDGTNAFLVAIDSAGRLLASEEAMVDATPRNSIRDIFLIDHVPTSDEREALGRADAAAIRLFLNRHRRVVRVNPRLLAAVELADIIVYSPGTQHSSLFPSYLTPGLSAAIARNLSAIKLLITNIQADAGIADHTAVDIIEQAVYYLKEKNRLSLPTPSLITHYLINDPRVEPGAPYVPLGRLENLHDPRLVRISNYEEGVSGRHDASKILTPFIQSFLSSRARQRVAVLLHDGRSADKLAQTILEMIRGGVGDVPVSITLFHDGPATLDGDFLETLPFEVHRIAGPEGSMGAPLGTILEPDAFDYVVLFESSGMYRGEDLVGLISHLPFGRLDAVWGSRRLSIKDIEQSYRLRYRHNAVLGTFSYVGSHLLSVAYLGLYGRYISDTLSGARAVRTGYFIAASIDPAHKQANHHLLSALLSDRADILETPVQFLPLSPDRVKRTSVTDGIKALLTILRWRFMRLPALNGRRRGGRRTGSSACVPGRDETGAPSNHDRGAAAAGGRPR